MCSRSEAHACAFQVVPRATLRGLLRPRRAAALRRRPVDVITYEFENVPAEAAAFLAGIARPCCPIRPCSPSTQDRLVEKTFIAALGIATAPFAAVDTPPTSRRPIAQIGLPAVMKTRRLGYDGKGQKIDAQHATKPAAAFDAHVARCPASWRASCRSSARSRWSPPATPTARSPASTSPRTSTPTTSSSSPGCRRRCPPAVAAEARRIAGRIAEAFDYVGVLAVELFVVRDGVGPRGAGQRDRAAGAQFRPLDASTAPRCRSSSSISARSPAGRWPSRCATAGGDEQPDRRRGRTTTPTGSPFRAPRCTSTARREPRPAARWAT